VATGQTLLPPAPHLHMRQCRTKFKHDYGVRKAGTDEYEIRSSDQSLLASIVQVISNLSLPSCTVNESVREGRRGARLSMCRLHRPPPGAQGRSCFCLRLHLTGRHSSAFYCRKYSHVDRGTLCTRK
jgi:hypothetical protein